MVHTTNKAIDTQTNNDRNKHLVQNLINDYNDRLKEDEAIHIVVESNNDMTYKCCDGVDYGDVCIMNMVKE